MDVGVRHFHAEHGDPDALAGHCGLERCRDLAGEVPQSPVGRFVEVEDVVVLDILGDYKGVALASGLMSRKA